MSGAIRFGRYDLLKRLAQGGMAEVFLARSGGASGFQKELVIKRILPELSGDEQFIRMFVDEARIAAQLHHPNIVQVFDFDEIEGTYFIAMEYVEGCDLRTIMEETATRNEELDVAEALYLTMEVAKALDYAHRRKQRGKPLNIVHRDVSPHNVLVSFDGAVKLTDFGIAKAQSRATRTQDGIVKGKISYMSPEQARGKRLDGRSDLFSLGTVLFELVTLRRLFFADSDREILRKVMAADVPSPRSFKRDLPTEVERIIMKLLTRLPAQRYPTAAAVLEDLSRAYHSLAEGSAELLVRRRLARIFPDRASQATPADSPAIEPGSWPPDPDWPGRTGTPVLLAPDETPTPAGPHSRPPPIPAGARAKRPEPDAETAFASPALGSDPAQQTVTAETRLHDPRVRERSRRGRQLRRFDRQRVVRAGPGAKNEAFFKKGTLLYRSSENAKIDRRSLRPKRSLSVGTAVTIASLLVAVGALVGVLFALGRSDPSPDLPPPGSEAPTTEAGAPPEPPVEPGLVEGTVVIRTVPSGAQVQVDGRALPGRTPLAVSVPVDRTATITVSLEGFIMETFEVTVDQAQRPVERLVRLRDSEQ